MKRNYLFFIFCIATILSINIILSEQCFSLEKETHKALNEHIVKTSINDFQLNLYISNQLGFEGGIENSLYGKEVWEWIRDGGKYEDEPAYTRSRNHFHDPLKLWDEAGLNNLLFTGLSSALWIQDQTNQRLTDLGGKWSWQDAREDYFEALTGMEL